MGVIIGFFVFIQVLLWIYDLGDHGSSGSANNSSTSTNHYYSGNNSNTTSSSNHYYSSNSTRSTAEHRHTHTHSNEKQLNSKQQHMQNVIARQQKRVEAENKYYRELYEAEEGNHRHR